MTRRVAIVTGSTSGIGEAIARRLHADGLAVLATGRRSEAGQRLCRELGHGASFVALDLTAPNAATALVHRCIERFERLDVLVNSAAVDHTADLLDVPLDDVRAVFEVNFLAPFSLLQEAARWMQPGGAVVNVTSRLASVGVPTMGAYGASKGALHALTVHAAVELAPAGVRVNAVAPGMTRTPLFDAWLRSQGDPNLAVTDVVGRIPMGRLAEPEDVASAVSFLASSDASHITGVSLAVDGGYTAA